MGPCDGSNAQDPSVLIDELRDRYSDLPAAMRDAKRWLVYRLEQGATPDKKPRKVPIYLNDLKRGKLDTPEDVANLGTFDEALSILATGRYSGLGFALGPDGTGQYWQGIDLDGTTTRPELAQLADDLPGYTETSPSGKGRHAIGYGRWVGVLGPNSSGIEAYSEKRFFTVTGEKAGVGEVVCLADFIEGVLAPRHGRAGGPEAGFASAPRVQCNNQTIIDLRSALNFLRSDDRGQWVRIGHALKVLGEVGRGMWMDWSTTSTKFALADAALAWDSFSPDRTGYQTVFTTAQAAGWLNPRSNAAHLHSNAEHDQSPFNLLTAREICAMPRLKWRVSGVLPEQGVVSVYGQSGSGKSFLALDLAAAVSSGAPWFDCEVNRAGVVYVCLENEGGLRQRVEAWERYNRQLMPDTFRAVLQPFQLTGCGDVEKLSTAVIATIGSGAVVIIDTLNRAAVGVDENSSKEMGRVIQGAKELQERIGGLIIVVHHTGKDETKGLRGHSSLLAALDAAIEVSRGNQRWKWCVKKSKDGNDDTTHTFRLERIILESDEAGREISSCAVASLDAPVDFDDLKVTGGVN